MSLRRKIVLAAGVLVLLATVTVVGGVMLLTQTVSGRALVMRLVAPTLDAALPGRLYVGALSGNLITDIRFDSLELTEPNGKPFIATGPVRVVYDPRDLLDRRIVIKLLEIERPQVILKDYGNDDWSWRRALIRPASRTRLPRRPGSLGDFITIDSTVIREARLVAVLPWELSDTLVGAKRDSALNYNLMRMDGPVRYDEGRLVRDWRFERAMVMLGPSRIADPDSAGLRLDVKRTDAVWVFPPFWFRNVSGTLRQLGDTLWFDDTKLELANSHGHGSLKVVWGSDLPVRYDIRVQGDSVSMRDIAFIDDALPRTGGGTMALRIVNDSRNLDVLEYRITRMDARSMKSRLTGNMTFAVGGPVLRVSDVDLELQPAHTDLLKQFNGEPFPLDWQGELRGHVRARGGPVNRFVIDNANLAFHDEHVPGAVSRATANGMVNIYTPSEAILMGMDVNIEQLDFRTPRYVNPLFVELAGIARGTVRLDSLWYDARFSNADIEHVDGPGLPSRITGSGNYTILPQGVRFDVDVEAAPLSYTMLSRSYPGMPLRGSAVGRIAAKGMAEGFTLNAILAGEGGELSFDGRVDAFEPHFSATGNYRVRGVNLQSLLELSSVPQTTLSFSGTMDLSGADIASIAGPLSATIDQFSRVADVTLYSGSVRALFDSGLVRLDTLLVESTALRLSGQGGLGLIASRSDSIGLTATVDSVGGLRPWIAPASGDGLLPAETDTLRGTLDVRVLLSGTLDTTAASGGLAVSVRADASDLGVGNSHAQRATLSAVLNDLLRSANGDIALTGDGVKLGAFDVARGVASAEISRGVAEHFSARLRTPGEAVLALAGGMVPVADTTVITLDTLDISIPPQTTAQLSPQFVQGAQGARRTRGFSLLTPAVARLVSDSTGRLDSLVLVHSDTGRIAIRGGLLGGGTVSGHLEADRVSLYDIGQWLHSTTIKGGSLSIDAILGGTRSAPVVDATVSLKDAEVGAAKVAEVEARGNYKAQELRVGAALLADGRRAFEANGVIPMDLALFAGRKRMLDAPLSASIVSRNADLSAIEAILPVVRNASGTLATDVTVSGTWERPRMDGILAVQNGTMTLDNLGVRLEHADADVVLSGDTIRIRSLRASSGGVLDTVGVSGTVAIADFRNPVFDLTLGARNFLAMEKARQASIMLTTTSPLALTGPSNGATVRGALRVDRGRIYINSLTQRRGLDLTEGFELIDTTAIGMNALLPNAPNMLLRNLLMDNVTVEVGNDVWLRSPEANIKLGGALRVTRSMSRDRNRAVLALSDSLTVERGTYTLDLGLARPGFEVERGVVRFFGDPDLEPALDITAMHTVRELRPNSNRQDVRIRVAIAGTTSHPTLTLSSADNPPIPESDLLSYLVTGEPAYALLGTPYAEQGVTLAMRLASSYLSSRLAGGRFDVVQVEPTALTPGDAADLRQTGLGILLQTRVGVGVQLAQSTYLTFSTALCGLAPQTGEDPLSLFAQGLGVKVERRLDAGLSLSMGLEPGSSALACGRQGISRTFQQTPPQVGFDLFRSWTF